MHSNHFYPFGMNMEGVWMNDAGSKDSKYLYNGKELNDDFGLGWYAYGFRYYDPCISRFIEVDPISDKFPHASTYNYAENRVPNAIDLHGLQAYVMTNYYNYDNSSGGTKVELDKNLRNVNGIYVVSRYTDGQGRLSSISTRVADFNEFPDMFPNRGKLARNDGKPLVTLEGEAGAIYGEVAMDVESSLGSIGFELGAEGNLGKVEFSSNSGVDASSIFTGDKQMSVGAGFAIGGVGGEYRHSFEGGVFLNKNGYEIDAPGVQVSGNFFSPDAPSIKIGIPELKLSLGFGVKGALYLSINPQPILSKYEGALKKAFDEKPVIKRDQPNLKPN